MPDKTFLILGGGGMIGYQIAYRICRYLNPERMIIASLFQAEVREAITQLEKEFPDVDYVGFWGDVFVRSEFNHTDRQQRQRRSDLLQDHERRVELFEDLFGEPDEAYHRSQLVQLILKYKPDVVVDGINTATAISYQDIYTAAELTRRDLNAYLDAQNDPAQDHNALREMMTQSVESLVISQYIPQLIRHVVMINRAMREVDTRMYLKVGTTGTGGMGLNIPYTHGEDKPSAKLMSKTAIAFAHTGLLFLMARTMEGPIVKEVKPAALVGWTDVTRKTIKRRGQNAQIFTSQPNELNGTLSLHLDESTFDKKEKLQMVVVDTGENGVFTKGEFETITAIRQMELITPEEIARACELEIKGINTGKDVVSVIDGAVLGPTYRGGYLRRQALVELNWLEQQTDTPSVALGELGPPELSKLLWESYLLKRLYNTLEDVLEFGPNEREHQRHHHNSTRPPQEIAERMNQFIQDNPEISDLITSTGVPILLPDGKKLLRGPFIRIPEVAGRNEVAFTETDLDTWARKGWVDLRPENMERWQKRFRNMHRAREQLRGRGSAAVNRKAYMYNKIFIGEVVGWVFNNEMGGYRIK